MPTSRHWSNASAPCRLEWRPSRLLAGVLLALGVLGAAAIIASEIPRLAAWPSALVAVGYGVWLTRRELRRPSRSLIIPMADSQATLDGAAITDFQVQWRGPLAFLQWRDAQGRRQRMQCWPDTLSAPARRELRLAMAARSAAPAPGSVAPLPATICSTSLNRP